MSHKPRPSIAAPDPGRTLSRVMARDRGRLVAALASRLSDIDLAEDALSEACESALIHWQRSGVPDNPEGWLLVVARRKAIDQLRRRKRFGDGPAQVARLIQDEAEGAEVQDIPDERLRLIFTCCHPALDQKSRVALTLRLLGGLSTAEIARAFLDAEPTMGQRISRAKAKIAAAGIPFRVPGPEMWSERLTAVLDVIYLIFNAGYMSPEGEDPARDLCDEAIFLARLLVQISPDDAETEGALALLLLLHARRDSRRGDGGSAVALEHQDPALWNHDLVTEGQAVLARAMQRRTPGAFQIKAALQALHIDGRAACETDWRQIAMLYTALLRFEDTPVVRLNRAVALAETGAFTSALGQVRQLESQLRGYQPYYAALANLLARTAQIGPALEAFDRAIALARTEADRVFLLNERRKLE